MKAKILTFFLNEVDLWRTIQGFSQICPDMDVILAGMTQIEKSLTWFFPDLRLLSCYKKL